MRLSKIVFAAASGLALMQAQAAQASQCVTEDEMSGIVGYALPSVLDGAMKSCKPHLSPTGYFATKGPDILARYAARKDANWPAAKAAFIKLGAEKDDKLTATLSALPDQALQPFAEAMVTEMVGAEIKPGQCVAIERGVRLLSPLPPENTAELVTFIVGMADKPGKKSGFTLCQPAN